MSSNINIRINNMEVDYVVKRNGSVEEMKFDKINNRLKKLSNNLCINSTKITQKICNQIYPNIKTSELDELGSQICSSLATEHPDYGTLASNLIISNHHKNTFPSFTEKIRLLFENNLVSEELYNNSIKYSDTLNDKINYDRDFFIDYFGFKTLEKSYLIRIKGKIIERPQDLFMRVSIGIHGDDIKDAIETYDYMSTKYFTHATPTLFNAGTNRPQLSSCFLLSMKDDSIDGIFSTLKDCALISKWAGGIGLHLHNVRSKNSPIRGTNGISNGLTPMLRVFNNTARYVDQGGGKRNGSIAIYLEPWHKDIFDFLELKKNHGHEEDRARDLFYALWINDLFMKRVESNQKWTLFCPDSAPGLSECYGDEFDSLYTKYECDNIEGSVTIEARKLWFKICESQIETGTPYICYKDAANRKSNQQNLGTIKSSNLCTEIIEYSSPTEYAVCNLASIGLSKFVDIDKNEFDYDKLHKVTKIITKNLNKIIDINFYPIPESERSNKLHRPIGIGVQGLADVFAMLKLPFDSEEAKIINNNIFETIYHGSLETSMEISKKRSKMIDDKKQKELILHSYELDTNKYNSMKNDIEYLDSCLKLIPEEINRDKYLGSYSSFENSPMSKGLFQFDLWKEQPSERYNWNSLRTDIKTHGIRNSLLLAPMPTASTSQILGNNECIEPFTSNIYLRRVLSGEYVIINKHLIKNLIELNLWDVNMKNEIIKNNGSVQNISSIPDNLKEIFKTVWEIGNKSLIDMAADRGKYICQSQSLNLFMDAPDFNKLSSMHFYSWKKGLKTGMYYLRTKPVVQAQQFTIDPDKKTNNETNNINDNSDSNSNSDTEEPVFVCRRDDPECLMCGS
jgi:ribonucleoside-diphosphate reductase alpha subunit